MFYKIITLIGQLRNFEDGYAKISFNKIFFKHLGDLQYSMHKGCFDLVELAFSKILKLP